jgi:hypothetical protein
VLIEVVKPSIERSPPPAWYQRSGGDPGRAFSQATGLAQGVWAAAGAAAARARTPATISQPACHRSAAIPIINEQRAGDRAAHG